MSPKVWFITGCSSGFGLSVTRYALQRGDKVVATLLEPGELFELTRKYQDRLLVVRLDVTRPAEVTAAFAASRTQFGRIDVVVNNAGFGVLSEVEGTCEDSARGVFEVNFWGASHVSKEAVRFFREENKPMGGRLLQVSSMNGIRASAGTVYYSATKFALEALSEGLAEELDPEWNIRITILEPGPFLTKCATVHLVKEPAHPAYTNPSLPSMKKRKMFENPTTRFDGDPKQFAEVIYRAAYLADPPLRLPIHNAALSVLRGKGKELLETADKWESWSEDVLFRDQARKKHQMQETHKL